MSDEPGPDTDRDELGERAQPILFPPDPRLPREARTMPTEEHDTDRKARKPPEAPVSDTQQLLDAIQNLGKSFDDRFAQLRDGQEAQAGALKTLTSEVLSLRDRQSELEKSARAPSWQAWLALAFALLDLGAVGVAIYVAIMALKIAARVP